MRRRVWRCVAMLVLLAGPAAGQAPPNRPASPPPGRGAPLQAEPGDIWADVKSWEEEHRRRLGRAPAAARSGDRPAQRQRQPRPAGQPQPQVQPR